MRWFKHMTGSNRDEKLTILRSKLGLEGYGRYWFLLELIAEHVDENNKTSLSYPPAHWRRILDTYHTNGALIFLQCIADLSLISLQCKPDLWIVDCPKILKYRDEWTIKQSQKLRSYSGPSRAPSDPDPEGYSVDKSTGNKLPPPKKKSKKIDEKNEKTEKHPTWGDGLDLLVEQGMLEDQGRRFIGGLIKKHGEENVQDAFIAAFAENPVEVKAYLLSVLKNKQNKTKPLDWESSLDDQQKEILSYKRMILSCEKVVFYGNIINGKELRDIPETINRIEWNGERQAQLFTPYKEEASLCKQS